MSAKALSAMNVPGYTVLYHDIEQAAIKNFFDGEGNIANRQRIISKSHSDFLEQEGYCFAMDRDFAINHANYIKRRQPDAPLAIVHIAIPISAIEKSFRNGIPVWIYQY
ncbi:hypothetical protein PT974_01055 [Cladobotryum mycophilum]|uniref:Uncharacterized protein n=1 Tax=Cladobotryum mycophilum TaxID=491253 RepID=A0ABR0T2P1_9HYPO